MSTAVRSSRAAQHKLAVARAGNLRQLVLRTSRVLNAEIVADLIEHGYAVRGTHTALLSNLDAHGNSITAVAERAGMTKQAMGRIADELEAAGYVSSERDPADRRSRLLRFTPLGWKLMLASFAALERVERRFAKRMGKTDLEALRSSLRSFLNVAESDSLPLEDER